MYRRYEIVLSMSNVEESRIMKSSHRHVACERNSRYLIVQILCRLLISGKVCSYRTFQTHKQPLSMFPEVLASSKVSNDAFTHYCELFLRKRGKNLYLAILRSVVKNLTHIVKRLMNRNNSVIGLRISHEK